MANATGGRYARSMAIRYIDSAVGRLALEGDGDTLTGVRWAASDERASSKLAGSNAAPVLSEAARQLDRYFSRKLKRFDLKLDSGGTPFQQRVWAMMRAIP